MIEENVVSQAGAVFKLSAEDIERRVRASGFVPRQRNMRYELLPLRRGVDAAAHDGAGDGCVLSEAVSLLAGV